MPRGSIDDALTLLLYPSRLERVVYQLHLETVRDLVKLRPSTLLEQRSFGRKTLREVERAIADHLGESWEEAHIRIGGAGFSDEDRHALGATQPSRFERRHLDLYGAIESLPPAVRALRIEEAFSRATVRWLRHYGKPFCVSDLPELPIFASSPHARERLTALSNAVEELRKDPFVEHATWRELFENLLEPLLPRYRRVIEERSGLREASRELGEIAEQLGVSRQRVHQMQNFAIARIAHGAWRSAVRERLRAAIRREPAIDLEELGARDEFFAVEKADVCAFTFFVNRLLGASARVLRGASTDVLAWDDDEVELSAPGEVPRRTLSLRPKAPKVVVDDSERSRESSMPKIKTKTSGDKKQVVKTTKAAFVRAIPETVSAKEVVAGAKAAGMTLTEKHVYVIRFKARKKKTGRQSLASMNVGAIETSFRRLVLTLGVAKSRLLVADVEKRLNALVNGR